MAVEGRADTAAAAHRLEHGSDHPGVRIAPVLALDVAVLQRAGARVQLLDSVDRDRIRDQVQHFIGGLDRSARLPGELRRTDAGADDDQTARHMGGHTTYWMTARPEPVIWPICASISRRSAELSNRSKSPNRCTSSCVSVPWSASSSARRASRYSPTKSTRPPL